MTGERARRAAPGIALALVAALALPGRAGAQTQVEANVTRHGVPLGESTTLVVTVRGARGSVDEPSFAVPGEIDVVASGRSQSFSWINGRSSNEVSFRYEIAPRAEGRYSIGPIQVKVATRPS